MPHSSAVGNGGLNIPIELYLKKQQTTCLPENAAAFNDYSRSVLTDLRPDQPLWEEEEIRRQNQSAEKLNTFHQGRRSEKLPDLPEGTFLDAEFLEHDSRGPANEPAWSQYKEDRAHRIQSNYKFRSDQDYTRPQGQLSPLEITANKRQSVDQLASRWNVFSKGLVGPNPSSLLRYSQERHITDRIDSDRQGVPFDGATLANRSSVATCLEAALPSGWRSTTDHRFRIAHYTPRRSQRQAQDGNVRQNRTQAIVDACHSKTLSARRLPPKVYARIADVSKQRDTLANSLAGCAAGEERNGLRRGRRLVLEDCAELRQAEAPSATDPAHHRIGDQMYHQNTRKKFDPRKLDFNQQYKGHFRPQVLATIVSQAQEGGRLADATAVQRAIQTSATQDTILLASDPRSAKVDRCTQNESSRKTRYGHAKEASKLTIPAYGQLSFAKMQKIGKAHRPSTVRNDRSTVDARVNEMRKAKRRADPTETRMRPDALRAFEGIDRVAEYRASRYARPARPLQQSSSLADESISRLEL